MQLIVNIIIAILFVTSSVALLISLWSLHLAVLDNRILKMLGLNGARQALVRMHTRNAISRIFQSVGKVAIAFIVLGLPVPDNILPYEAVALGILCFSAVNIAVNYILDERDRKDILEKDESDTKNNKLDVAIIGGDSSTNTDVAKSD